VLLGASELSSFEVSAVVLLNIQAFWDVMLGNCIDIYRNFKDNMTVPSFKMSALFTHWYSIISQQTQNLNWSSLL